MTTENEQSLSELDQVDDLDVQDDLNTDDIEIVVDESDEPEVEETPDAEEAQAEPEEAAPEETASAEEEPDTELAAMPEKIKKRFAREKRLRDTIIQEREQIKSAAIQVAQFAQQREDEVVSLKKKNAALERQFIETLDYEAIVQAMRDDLVERFPLIAGVIDLESEPARKLIEALGGKVAGSVSKKTDYVVAGSEAGKSGYIGQECVLVLYRRSTLRNRTINRQVRSVGRIAVCDSEC
jgi:hypothetical protein